MDGDREQCLAAGTGDYITQPVRPDDIAAILRRWIRFAT
jgi:CheY-like chemotaxis protein